MVYFIIFSILSSVLATFLGSLLTLLNNKMPKIIISFFQNFSVGAIIAILFFDLINESIEYFQKLSENKTLNYLFPILIIFVSGILFFILHELIHKISSHHDHDKDDNEACDDHSHLVDIFSESRSTLLSSFIFFISITIHNIPEGLSLGSNFISTNEIGVPINGIILSLALFIHNILIGYSMCNSFLESKKSKKFAILITTSSSLASLIFSFISYFLLTINNNLLFSIILSISAGSLLYVLFIELFPQVYYKYKNKYSFLFILLGLLCISFIIFLGEG